MKSVEQIFIYNSMQTDQQQESLQTIGTILRTSRYVQLSINCLILIYIIVNILRKKQYNQPTIKMFLFCCLCYLIGMAAVLPHNKQYSADCDRYTNQEFETLTDVLNKMLENNKESMILCGLEAFFNLFFYDLAYFFAVFLTYQINCQIRGDHQTFGKRIRQNKKIWLFIIIMLAIYAFPFILMFISGNFEHYTYSYAPTGLTYQKTTFILYCGINFNQQSSYKWLAIYNVYCMSFQMLVFHLIYYFLNQQKTKYIKQNEERSPSQQLNIIWNKFSLLVLVIQFFNFSKLCLSLFEPENKGWDIFIIVLNYIFDLYPCFLLYFYIRYVNKMRAHLHTSTILQDQ